MEVIALICCFLSLSLSNQQMNGDGKVIEQQKEFESAIFRERRSAHRDKDQDSSSESKSRERHHDKTNSAEHHRKSGKGRTPAPEFHWVWSYQKYNLKTGPQSKAWGPLCHKGKRQSPINIEKRKVKKVNFSPLKFVGYGTPGDVVAHNNGHSVEVTGFDKWRKQPYISGGGLGARYNLLKFHFHWGTTNEKGSEHTVNGHYYPLEAHFVHLKAGLTAKEAAESSDAHAVVGVFFKEDKKNGHPLKQLEPAFKHTDSYNSKFNISDLLLNDMIPKHHSTFYRYNGSLTVPNCTESVVWTVLTEPLTVTTKQLRELRQHLTSTSRKLRHNFRETQPLNGRKVLFQN